MQRTKAVLALVLGLALGGTALAQEQHEDRDRNDDRGRVTQQDRRDQDRNAERDRQWRQGDRDDNRGASTWQWRQNQQNRDRDDRDRTYQTYPAYPNGGYYPNGRYPNGGYYPNGQYPNGGYYPNGSYPTGAYGAYGNQNAALSQAQQIGYTDGINDARTDMASGRAYQPTRNANYRHANRGWNRNMVDQGTYQEAYRQAYLQGYQQAYGQGGYGWPY